eukprot:CAMPEP_0174899394 /NCGR_PEP_ID=MMETSP0167-20121228/26977_1 /TAXON_ID=38298 /ORGANISM="Rhodella maculata, Strain CCMP736" /LENGTH=113 /DNA_ID=CAMNT_0016140389 /DNA_START=104 /DNA_END=445 /DNA_ORIENTATION=+
MPSEDLEKKRALIEHYMKVRIAADHKACLACITADIEIDSFNDGKFSGKKGFMEYVLLNDPSAVTFYFDQITEKDGVYYLPALARWVINIHMTFTFEEDKIKTLKVVFGSVPS